MVSGDQFTANRRRRRHRGFGGRWWWGESEVTATPFREWKGDSVDRSAAAAVSARKLAAALWRLAATTNGDGSVRWRCRLSFDRLGIEFRSSSSIPKSAEGVTKWDNCNSRLWGDFSHFKSKVKHKQDDSLSEFERVSCMIKKFADAIKRERKNCRKMDIVNLKLLRDIADTKLSARRFIRNLEKEKKTRVELDGVCDKLAKKIGGTKARIMAVRNHQRRIRMEVEEERKMLQLAEVWREEQTQTKMADAKLILEDKYSDISNRVADLKAFMGVKGGTNMTRKQEVLRQGFDSGNVKGVKNFMFKFPKSDKEFFIAKDSQELPKENASEKMGVSEISSLTLMQPKKKGSSARKILQAWPRSHKGTCKTIKTDGNSDRSVCSNVSIASPQGVSGEGEIEIRRNPHVIRAMKGHIEWPRNIRGRGMADNLLETITTEKTRLRNVLKQRS